MIWFLACVKNEPPREIAALPAVVEEAPPPPVARPDPLPGWRSGFTSAPALGQRVAEAWGFTLGGPITEPIAGDTLGPGGGQAFAVADGRLVAFSADGKRGWEARIDARGGPYLLDSSVIVGSDDGRVHWVDRATGKDSSATGPGSAVVGRVAPVDGGFAWVTAGGQVSSTAGWNVPTSVVPSGRAAADGSTVYFASTDGKLHAAGPRGLAWSCPLPAPPVDGPALDAERAYVSYGARGGEPGGVVAIWRVGADAGKEAWRFPTGFAPEAAPAVHEAVYVPDKDGTVYALDPVSGGQLWTAEGYGEFLTQPVIAGKTLYVGNSDGALYAIDSFDGGVDWKLQLGAPVTAGPALLGDGMVVGLANGRVVGLRP
ncbi:MAG: PQQ-binding-like beta-propeller repeat protein [Deltaproteobacteria bacterium]|nr:PQQ-binding-like beta-propeller repeat protein [Deltaproteobacteria bacterium]